MATFKIISSETEFRALQPRWAEIVNKCPHANVFKTFEWNYFGWTMVESVKCPDAKPYIIYVTRDGHEDEKAILPFRLHADGTLRFLCSSMTDVQDAIVAEHNENWHVFFSDIARFLMEQAEIKYYDLTKMEGDSELLAFLSVHLPSWAVVKCDVHSVIRLMANEEISGAFTHITSKDRSYLRKLMQSYPEDHFNIYSLESKKKFPKEKIIELTNRMISCGRRSKNPYALITTDFMGVLYEKGLCEVAALESDETADLLSYRLLPPVSSIGLGNIVFWVVKYADTKMTTVADIKYMAHKTKTMSAGFDFGTGGYSYKLGTFRPNVIPLYAIKVLKTDDATFVNLLRDIYHAVLKYMKRSNLMYKK